MIIISDESRFFTTRYTPKGHLLYNLTSYPHLILFVSLFHVEMRSSVFVFIELPVEGILLEPIQSKNLSVFSKLIDLPEIFYHLLERYMF